MTFSVYKLIFPNSTKVYVGITKNSLEGRLSQHLEKLCAGTHNKKLTNDYPSCGLPSIVLLEECISEPTASTREKYWITKLDSYSNGFNGNLGGWAGTAHIGEDNPSALYTSEDYECVFKLLANTDMTLKEISEQTTVSYSVVRDISSKASHTYLKSKFPEEYALMEKKNRRLLINLKSSYPKIKSPEGVEYIIRSISEFARIHGINRCSLSKLVNGNRSHAGGYTLC